MRVGRLLRFLAILAGCMLYAVPRWLTDEFGRVSIDQILYHLRFGSEGVLSSDPELIRRFLWRALALPAALAVLLWGVDGWLRHLRRHPDAWPRPWLRRAGRALAVALRWAAHHTAPRIVPLMVLGVGVAFFVDSFSVARYVRGYFGDDYFAEAYVDPGRATLQRVGKQPKSLVLIYVESLETSYSDPALFGHDLLHRLNALKSRPGVVSFDSYRELMGAHFTIASLVSTQCGVPLKSIAMFGGNVQGEKVERYLPRARCLGDLLAAEGYRNVFLNGSSLAFAGVGKFFHDHRYHRVMGREEWIEAGEPPAGMSGWGLRDDALFRRARAELGQLMKSKQPFNLTVLTIDTHHPYGHLSPECARRGHEGFEGVVECTADLVAEFVEYIIARGWLDRVAIVVQGDHLAMGNSSYQKLVRNPERRVFNLLISNDAKLAANTREVTHFDMLPTILDLVGLQVKDGRAGLGYSAIGPVRAPRPPNHVASMSEKVLDYSATYRSLWEPPEHLAEQPRPAPPQPAVVDAAVNELPS
ncbi:sulfatase-like hydrolase/transferase [Thauera sp. ZXT1-4]|uniref:sulfatase-like hydrolase/transferase n=1 Tax=Thauera sp. ZXT1-4 TaxID=3460294 RepID=UPI0040409194